MSLLFVGILLVTSIYSDAAPLAHVSEQEFFDEGTQVLSALISWKAEMAPAPIGWDDRRDAADPSIGPRDLTADDITFTLTKVRQRGGFVVCRLLWPIEQGSDAISGRSAVWSPEAGQCLARAEWPEHLSPKKAARIRETVWARLEGSYGGWTRATIGSEDARLSLWYRWQNGVLQLALR